MCSSDLREQLLRELHIRTAYGLERPPNLFRQVLPHLQRNRLPEERERLQTVHQRGELARGVRGAEGDQDRAKRYGGVAHGGEVNAYSPARARRLSSTFMKLMYASYGLSYGLKYLWTSPSDQYFVHM